MRQPLMITAAGAGGRAHGAAAALSANEVMDTIEPDDADDDQVDCHHVIQQSRHEQDQHAGNEGNHRRDVGKGNGHWDLLRWQSMLRRRRRRVPRAKLILLGVIIGVSGGGPPQPSMREKSATVRVASRISLSSLSRFSRSCLSSTLTVTLSKNLSTCGRSCAMARMAAS